MGGGGVESGLGFHPGPCGIVLPLKGEAGSLGFFPDPAMLFEEQVVWAARSMFQRLGMIFQFQRFLERGNLTTVIQGITGYSLCGTPFEIVFGNIGLKNINAKVLDCGQSPPFRWLLSLPWLLVAELSFPLLVT